MTDKRFLLFACLLLGFTGLTGIFYFIVDLMYIIGYRWDVVIHDDLTIEAGILCAIGGLLITGASAVGIASAIRQLGRKGEKK